MELFQRANILLPQVKEPAKWCVIACDQYTSEPEYWTRVERLVGDAPSALRLILPEAHLEAPDVDARIDRMGETMADYLASGVFEEFPNCYILTERTQRDGRRRYGVIGNVDLAGYDYHADARTPVRATEGTVLSRIPPRVRVRKDAPLELPHIMLLLDDPEEMAIELLVTLRHGFRELYDLPLMEESGHLRGWLVPEDAAALFAGQLEKLYRAEQRRAECEGRAPLFLAVGDGNHSLATAKECHEAHGGPRYALCELCNLHSPALDFEPIHRVVFDVDEKMLLEELTALCTVAAPASSPAASPSTAAEPAPPAFSSSVSPSTAAQPASHSAAACTMTETSAVRETDAVLSAHTDGAQRFTCLLGERQLELTFTAPTSELTVGSLQNFLDRYLERHGGRCDYIHGEEVVARLSGQPNTVGFLLPGMKKEELFPAVAAGGALPRKTFSMGHAWDKRFYNEAQRLRRE